MKKKYQPSNGSEGSMFMSFYCENCKHEQYLNTGVETDKKCDILSRSMILDVKDENYPEELTFDEEDQPTCTKFSKWNWSKNVNGQIEYPEEEETIDPDQISLF